MSAWPPFNEYTIAVQNPQLCFRDPDLKGATVAFSKRTRMPLEYTGNFAQVYDLRNSRSRWAVKCFTRSEPGDLKLRYSAIAQAISASGLSYFTEFLFIDDEILVNGKRYPIVKMQWIDGQSLDKHVESHLFQPQALLDIASKVLNMVRDLEARRIAHGDLQHGNIVITQSGLKLVDYDGMFVPSLTGKPASENGLPSYQHPARGPGHFGVGLDRFALLVICTGLCALAVEPSLWYEFNTGDNLLFTSSDFKHPKSSKLFGRLSLLRDTRLRTWADLLRVACDQNPLFVSIPSSMPLHSGVRQPPWWVTLQPPPTGEKAAVTSDTPAPAPDPPRLFWGRVPLGTVGIMALAIGRFLGIELALVAVLLGAIGYLLLGLYYYKLLPPLVRQRELQAKLRQLRRELQDESSKKSTLEQQITSLAQAENQEKAHELKHYRENHMAAALSGIPVSGLTAISGIGPQIVGNFRFVGVHNAWQLKQLGPYASGVGSKRRSQILGLLSQWERAAAAGSPNSIPADKEAMISSKYQQQRQPLVSQIEVMSRRIASINSDAGAADWQYKQIHVPTFSRFLKNTL